MGTKKGRKHFGEAIIEDVIRLRSEGKTNREISELFGFEGKDVIKKLIGRHRRKVRLIEAGSVPRRKGRPRKYPESGEEAKETVIKQLKMENQLLRSFLYETGRR